MAAAILGVGRALGKVILCGEHAVVYGRPALAAPVTQVWAEASVEVGAPGSGLVIWAADLDEEIAVRNAPADQPLAAAVRLALAATREQGTGSGSQWSEVRSQRFEVGQHPAANSRPASDLIAGAGLPTAPADPDWRITVRSTIPIASGMGSGAAVSAAIIRAMVAANQRINEPTNGRMTDSEHAPRITHHAVRHTQYAIPPAALSALVYAVERLHHGTPSGIDNTVIAYEQPVYFVRGQPPQPFAIGRPFTLVIADTGIRSPTRLAVGDVRRAWEQSPARFEALFDRIAALVEAARTTIAAGRPEQLGPLMDANHALLREIGVSCPELDALTVAARAAGALGAKLSGAGRGGNMIALVTDETAPRAAEALTAAGAARVIVTEVGGK